MTDRLDRAHLRACPRFKIFQPTDMTMVGKTSRVHLLNLSVGGALIYAADPPEPGTKLSVRCGMQTLSARVAWRDGRRFGVAFKSPLRDADVRQTIADQDALVSAVSRRSGGFSPT